MSDKDLQKMDLPEPLMKMMGTLVSNYEIHNWSIYSNNSKNTCLVIRFSDTDGCTQPAHYRRISNNQLARNKARSCLHKQNNDKVALDTTNHKRRKIDNLKGDSPELSRVQSSPHLHAGFIDSPILPVKVDHYTNSPTISVSPITSDISLFDNCISSPSNVSTNPVIEPVLKLDTSTQVKYDTQHISTQVDRACFQIGTSTQCGVKSKLKSTQTRLVKCSDEAVQAVPDPILYEDSCVQHQMPVADKCVQFGSDFFTRVDSSTQISPPKSDIKPLREYKCASAPRHNKSLGHTIENCNTYCYLAGFKLFDEKGHSDHCYHRCRNCRTFICDVCIDDVSLYRWANCCKNPESDGVLYSSGLTPKT